MVGKASRFAFLPSRIGAVRRSFAFTVHRSPFSVQRSAFSVHRSPFTVRRSPFTVHRSAASAGAAQAPKYADTPTRPIVDSLLPLFGVRLQPGHESL